MKTRGITYLLERRVSEVVLHAHQARRSVCKNRIFSVVGRLEQRLFQVNSLIIPLRRQAPRVVDQSAASVADVLGIDDLKASLGEEREGLLVDGCGLTVAAGRAHGAGNAGRQVHHLSRKKI